MCTHFGLTQVCRRGGRSVEVSIDVARAPFPPAPPAGGSDPAGSCLPPHVCTPPPPSAAASSEPVGEHHNDPTGCWRSTCE